MIDRVSERVTSKPTSEIAQEGLDALLGAIREVDQENLRLKKGVLLLAHMELLLRQMAPSNSTARELLEILDESKLHAA